MRMLKKIIAIVNLGAIAAFILISGISTANAADGTNSSNRSGEIGKPCSNNNDCPIGDCETSQKLDSAGNNLRFCDCNELDTSINNIKITVNESESCAKEFGSPPNGGIWKCVDGAFASHDLDYCVSVVNSMSTDVGFPIAPLTTGQESLVKRAVDAVLDLTAAGTITASDITKDINDRLQINIPGLNFTKLTGEVDPEGYLYIPWIGQYIAAVYKYAMVAASILAVVMIIIEGAKIIISAGGEMKTSGYKRIGQVVVGLIILWGSYAIMYNINPDLVTFQALKVQFVKPVDIAQIVDGGTDNGAAAEGVAGECAQETQLVSLKDKVPVSGGAVAYPMVLGEVLQALEKANGIAKSKGREIVVVSAARTFAKQTQLWNDALKKYGDEKTARKYVAKPSCQAPHITGRAVDVCLKNSPTCQKIKSTFASLIDPDVELLQNIMKE